MNPPDWTVLKNLPDRLRTQARNVEDDGWLSAARLMREAAAELEHYRSELEKSKMPIVPPITGSTFY